jgi:hypothetical protein
MKKILLILIVTCCVVYAQAQNPNWFNVQNFGAKGIKDSLVTKNIQSAIDKCYEAGGGVVYFPSGDYLSGNLQLKSNVTLHLEAGATIWASHNPNDYGSIVIEKQYEGIEMPSGNIPVLIYALKAKNITIEGKGTINGSGLRTLLPLKEVDKFTAEETENARQSGVDLKMYYKEPPFTNMVILDACENVTIRDISLIESTSWTLHMKWCQRVHVDGIYIESNLENGVNADGIDIDGCKDVTVSNCIVHTGDDAIVLKTTRTPSGASQSCENVMIVNCKIITSDSGIKLGTESFADYRHIVVSNCVIRNANRALSIIIRDGATVSDVLYSNISIECKRRYYFWWGNGDPIWLVVRKRNPESKVGSIKNVSFQHIMAHAQGTTKFEGFAGTPLENISISDMQIFMEAEDFPDKRAADAFHAHDVNGLTLKDVDVKWDKNKIEPKWKNAYSFDNVKDLNLDHLKGVEAPTGNGSFIALNNVENAIIERCIPMANSKNFLSAEGKTKNVLLNTIYTDDLKHKVKVAPSVKGQVIIK